MEFLIFLLYVYLISSLKYRVFYPFADRSLNFLLCKLFVKIYNFLIAISIHYENLAFLYKLYE